MSKMKEVIKELQKSKKPVNVFKPGNGIVHGRVEFIEDDVVRIRVVKPKNKGSFVIHYSQFSMEGN